MKYTFKDFAITCLGCKVNQAESAWLKEQLQGLKLQASQTCLALLLTCAVTGAASRQSRQMARRLQRANDQVLVSGCDVQLNPHFYFDLGVGVLPRAALGQLASPAPWPLWEGRQPLPAAHSGPWLPGWRRPTARYTRAQLKVQDGCSAHCAYCIVPHTRGLPRSLALDQAQEDFVRLAQAGAKEVVLSGIHLGRYQHGRHGLSGLVRALLAAHEEPRLRLSSLEAAELGHELIELMAMESRLCSHLHLPLQSGSNKVLRAMRRGYLAEEYAATVWRAHGAIANLCLGVDVLVGLPGEDEAAFAETYALLQELPLAYLHVFPYSPRPGTLAADMSDRPTLAQVRRRARQLRQLGRDKWSFFLQKQIGRHLLVLVENNNMGRSDNYCPVQLSQELPPGHMAIAHIKGWRNGPQPCLVG